ncbi:serine protease Do [Mobilisporobacter senegalensis]|uniref:Serine protease Do n=1 Tax=Mobilisporobacter senegalensis TaxID=1329262 RepID=A0A3N1XPJ2_9FIRM|nr:trypsin-like peptidase domain-containing protein [Mobilisporobacter senegalensis]ROR28610.1 serine protease Do [Mobilisporobacter senegalensis]
MNSDFSEDKDLEINFKTIDNDQSDNTNSNEQEAVNNFILINERDQSSEADNSKMTNDPDNSGYLFWLEKSDRSNKNEETYGYSRKDKYGFDYNNIPHPMAGHDNRDSKKGVSNFAKIIFAAILFGIVAGLSFQGVNYVINQLNPKGNPIIIGNENANISQIEEKNTLPTTAISNGIEGDNDVSDVVEKTMPSIVSITSTVTQSYSDFFGNQYDKDTQGSGSGIIVGKNDNELLIVTNNHVITDSKAIKVTFINNEVLEAKIKGTDQTADLAVVAVNLSEINKETSDSIKIASLGNSDDVKVGQMAIAIGNALGYGQSVTVGYISAKDRTVSIDNKSMTLLQTDAAINPGNSGGALLNVNGEVIGINSVKYASSEVEGMGYAIPISKAIPIINELMNREVIKEGEEGYLGVVGQDVTKEMASMYKMPVGAYVVETVEGGAAGKAGILSGDIITAVNGMEATSMASVKEKVNGYPAGTKVSVTIRRRNGEEYEEKIIDVVLQKMDTSASNSTIEQEEDDLSKIPFGYEFNPNN